MSDERLGTIMSALDTPLVVVTAAETQERAGCLVGFHCQSSIEPARYCVRLSKANHTNRVVLCLTTEPVAVHTDGPFEPLRLSQAAHLEPGHSSQERHNPPTERAARPGTPGAPT